jgi:hypothetical protein
MKSLGSESENNCMNCQECGKQITMVEIIYYGTRNKTLFMSDEMLMVGIRSVEHCITVFTSIGDQVCQMLGLHMVLESCKTTWFSPRVCAGRKGRN